MRNIPNEGDRSRRNHGIHGLGGRLRGQRLACQYFRCLFSHKCLQYGKRRKIMATSKCTWSKQVITSLSVPQPSSKIYHLSSSNLSHEVYNTKQDNLKMDNISPYIFQYLLKIYHLFQILLTVTQMTFFSLLLVLAAFRMQVTHKPTHIYTGRPSSSARWSSCMISVFVIIQEFVWEEE